MGVIKFAERSKAIRGLANPRTFGQKAADAIAKWAGSWTFILSFVVLLIAWMVLNTSMVLFGVWDRYPFILLNLVLSCVAALQAPVILMSQNRQAQKDRVKAEYDYSVNRKSEKYIEEILKTVKKIDRKNKK
jgi:uncharacterized membrane protein